MTVNIGRLTSIQAFRHPRRDALVEVPSGRRRTFADLDTRTCRIANALHTRFEMKRGDRVAVLSKNAIEFVEVYLAAARAGFVTLALNWRLAVPELARILQDGEPRVVLADREFEPVVKQLQAKVDIEHWVTWNRSSASEYEALIAAYPDQESREWQGIGDKDPLLVLYTGGTTGASKGVLHSHRSAFTAMMNNTVAERVLPTDRYLLLGQMFHSAVILALNYLYHGCSVIVLNFDPQLALETIEAERVTATLAFPAMLQYMLWKAGTGAYDLSSLRNMQYGGGPMASNIILETLRLVPCSLIQCYGTSESVGVTFLPQEDHRDALRGIHADRLESCGREALLTQVRLLDEAGKWIPPDSTAVGEIVVRSESNMLGYWRRPDLNQEAWIGDWLRTGDIARWGDDRYLYIVDRAKDVIISGGENIYASQVEKAIYTHPSVLEAAVIGVRDSVWGEAVKAFVVLKPGMQASAEDIADAVISELGSYQRPKDVEFIAELPKSATGKIAKHELRNRKTPS